MSTQPERTETTTETTRFDALASSFAQTRSRRGTLRLLGLAAPGASSLSLLGHGDSQAKKQRKKKGGKKGGRKSPARPVSNTCNTTSGGTCGPAGNNCRCANGSAGGGGECARIPAGDVQPCPPSGACPKGQLCLKASDEVAYCLTPCQ
jgi:hypothetical protein